MEDASQPPHLQDALTCAVCLDICIRPCTTTCGHTFCRRCIRTVLNAGYTRQQSRCPSCRETLVVPPTGGSHPASAPRFRASTDALRLTHAGPPAGENLAINFALWSVIQALFPQHCAAAPESPAASAQAGRLRATVPTASTSQRPSRLGPGRLEARPFLPPRPAAPAQTLSPSASTTRAFNLAQAMAGLAVSPPPALPPQHSVATELTVTGGRVFRSVVPSPMGNAFAARGHQLTDVIDLTGDDSDDRTAREAARERQAPAFASFEQRAQQSGLSTSAARQAPVAGGDTLRRAVLHPSNRSGIALGGGQGAPRKIVSGLFYSGAPSVAGARNAGGREQQEGGRQA